MDLPPVAGRERLHLKSYDRDLKLQDRDLEVHDGASRFHDGGLETPDRRQPSPVVGELTGCVVPWLALR